MKIIKTTKILLFKCTKCNFDPQLWEMGDKPGWWIIQCPLCGKRPFPGKKEQVISEWNNDNKGE